MLEALVVAQILTWIVLVILVVVIIALARQIGVLHERVAPMGALMTDRGPEVGDMAPKLEVTSVRGIKVKIGGAHPVGLSTLMLFVSPGCPVCKKVLPVAKAFAAGEKLAVVLVGDGEVEEQMAMIREHALEDLDYVNSPQVGMAFHVGKLPYAVLIDEEGVIRAKGLVNSREHLESLVVAKETGYGSIQAYLKAQDYLGGSGAPTAGAASPEEEKASSAAA